jgi:hypothetical protein
LLGRGIPDFDASEIYSPNDIVQFAGIVYRSIYTGGPHSVYPPDVAHWEKWGHTDTNINDLIDSAINQSSTLATGVTVSGATLNAAHAMRFPGTTYKQLMIAITVTVSGSGNALITLSGAAAFNVTAITAVGCGPTTAGGPIVACDINSANSISVEVTNSSDGPTKLLINISGH